MHKGYAFVQFTNPFDARSACLGEDGRTVLSQILGEWPFIVSLYRAEFIEGVARERGKIKRVVIPAKLRDAPLKIPCCLQRRERLRKTVGAVR